MSKSIYQVPNSKNVSALTKRLFADCEAQEANKKVQEIADEAASLAAFKEAWQDANNASTVCEAKRLANVAIKKLRAQQTRKVSAVTPSVRAIVWNVLTRIVAKKFEEMQRVDAALFEAYRTGRKQYLDVTTSTDWLAEAANLKSTASFRGSQEGSFFHSLQRLGFATKENLNRAGERCKSGRTVALRVNTAKWFWGVETSILPVKPTQIEVAEPQTAPKILSSVLTSNDENAPTENPFFPPMRGNSTLKETNNLKKQITKESGEAIASMSSASFDATNQVNGECEYLDLTAIPSILVKNSAPRREFSEMTAIIEVAEKLLTIAKKGIYNDANLAAMKIRTNNEFALLYIKSWDTSLDRLVSIIEALLDSNMTLLDAAELIKNRIETAAKSLNEGKKAYIYAPEMWLRMDYKAGTLWNTIVEKQNTKTKAAETSQQQGEKAKSDSTDIEPFEAAALSWLDAQGFSEATKRFYVQKYGSNAVAWAAKNAKLKLEGGFKPRTSVSRYLHGVLKHLNPNTIEEQTRVKIVRHQPKPGHIWASWLEVIQATTKNSLVAAAFRNATATKVDFDLKEITVELRHENQYKLLETDEAIRCFKIAFRETGVKYKINYQIKNNG